MVTVFIKWGLLGTRLYILLLNLVCPWRVQGAFQFHVKVDDSDPDSDDLLDRVIVDLRLPISSSFTAVSQLGFYRVVTMQFRFRAMCQTNYHRSDCSVFCAPQDSDTLGHYTCGSDGGRVCRSGYSGVDCLTCKLRENTSGLWRVNRTPP